MRPLLAKLSFRHESGTSYFSAHQCYLASVSKKEWIKKKDRAFLWWVTTEWLIGIGLYILFAVLVKSNEFSYVKGLLGLS